MSKKKRNKNGDAVYVFTYGTLMNGKPNHYLLDTPDSEFIKEDSLSGYQMFDFISPTKEDGIYESNYPVILPAEGHSIVGEIYKCNYKVIPYLDQLEGEGTLYKKTLVETKSGIACYVYVGCDMWKSSHMLIPLQDNVKYNMYYYAENNG